MRKKRLIVLVLCLSLIVTCVVLAKEIISLDALDSATEQSTAKNSLSAKKNDIKLMKLSVENILDSKDLLLVNADNKIDLSFGEDEVVEAFKIIAIATSSITLNKTALDATSEMFKAAKKLGFNDFFVSSGYRSSERQAELYDEAEDKTYVQPPGASEHQLGLAVDIAVKGMSIKQLGSSKQGEWLQKNSWKYGLILRYPEDKKDITGISYEPWHFRYIGVPHAAYCYTNNICYEQYIELLQQEKSIEITVNEVDYAVYYERPENGILNVPETYENISSDNTGGYIILVRY